MRALGSPPPGFCPCWTGSASSLLPRGQLKSFILGFVFSLWQFKEWTTWVGSVTGQGLNNSEVPPAGPHSMVSLAAELQPQWRLCPIHVFSIIPLRLFLEWSTLLAKLTEIKDTC